MPSYHTQAPDMSGRCFVHITRFRPLDTSLKTCKRVLKHPVFRPRPGGDSPLRPPPRLKSPARGRSQLPVSVSAPASRHSPPKSPASDVSLIPVRGAALRHSAADPSVSRIPRLRLSESPPKAAKLTDTQKVLSGNDPPSASEESLVTTRNLRRNANEYLRTATSSSDTCHVSRRQAVTSVTSVSSHSPEPRVTPGPESLDSQPRTFIVSAGDDPQPAQTTESDPQPWDNNALTPEQEPDHQQQPEINGPTIYQSTVRQILTPYRNFFPQPGPNYTNSPAANNDGKCDLESESESSGPRLSDQLIRRSSGPEHDEYITLNINADFTHSETIDPETVGNTSEKNKQQKNVEKFSHLEPIYECFASGNA